MPGASTARGIALATAMSALALLSARIAPQFTERPTRCTSATSSPFLESAGTLSRSEWSRLAATNAFSTSWLSTRKSEILSVRSTAPIQPTTTDACSRPGSKANALMKKGQPETGASTSTRRTSSTRYLTRHRLPTSRQAQAWPVFGRGSLGPTNLRHNSSTSSSPSNEDWLHQFVILKMKKLGRHNTKLFVRWDR